MKNRIISKHLYQYFLVFLTIVVLQGIPNLIWTDKASAQSDTTREQAIDLNLWQNTDLPVASTRSSELKISQPVQSLQTDPSDPEEDPVPFWYRFDQDSPPIPGSRNNVPPAVNRPSDQDLQEELITKVILDDPTQEGGERPVLDVEKLETLLQRFTQKEEISSSIPDATDSESDPSEPQATGAIEGTVTSAADSLPVPDIYVCAYPVNWGASWCDHTDADGQYIINGLPTDQYRLEILADGWASEWYNNKRADWNADLVQVTDGQTTSGIDFALDPGGYVSGRVTDTSGNPLEYILVEAFSYESGGMDLFACSDADGQFSFSSIPYDIPFYVTAGHYLCGPGTNNYAPEFWEESPTQTGAAQITLNSGTPSIAGINFTLDLGGSVSGKVTSAQSGLPLSNVSVSVRQDYGDGYGYGYTDSNGNYLATGLPAGEYIAHIFWLDGYAFEYYNNKLNSSDANRIPVAAGLTSPGINFSLNPGGRVSGTVRNTSGDTLANMIVWIQFDDLWLGVCTDLNGQYEYASIPYGLDFTVFAGEFDCMTGSDTPYIPEYWEETPNYWEATPLTATSSKPSLTGIDFTLEIGGNISGSVTSAESGLPLSDIDVNVFAYDINGSGGYALTDSDGSYLVTKLAAGEYIAMVWEDGYAFEQYDDAISYTDVDLITVIAGQTTTGIDFALDPGGSVSGRVRNTSGEPLENVGVQVQLEDIGFGICTDSNGEYSFGSLPYGYQFTVFAGRFICDPGESPFIPEYWQETANPWEATPLTATSQNPDNPNIDFSLETGSTMGTSWVGGVVIEASQNIVAVGRPHIGGQIMTYDGFNSGSTTQYVPMLFKRAWTSYDSALYVQNLSGSDTANITIRFYDSNGVLNCTKTDSISKLSSKGYWLPGESCLPSTWVGGAVVSSDVDIVAVGRPHIGSQVTTYNGFSGGSSTVYIPMLFKNQWGYDSAFYVQNVDPSSTANISIKFYDPDGNLNCTLNDSIARLASKGWWLPAQGCLPDSWYGGVVVTADQDIVAVGRPHLGSEIMTYGGFAEGSTTAYVPMMYKNASVSAGTTYSSSDALYIQNVHATDTANITIEFYDVDGVLSCTKTDSIARLSSKGYWLPGESCLPSGWQGSVKVESNVGVVAIGRLHMGSQIMSFNGFTGGSTTSNLPMLFKNMWVTYNAAFQVENIDPSNMVALTLSFYDTSGSLCCIKHDYIPAMGVKSYWMPSLTCIP